ncbi:PepSY domain-containing protein [Psychrobacter sp. AOP22-C1-22]|uniref:PepSY domain-containing protein n=1 Tax=unclassified Psychrobacter TaxID=196806 RepID=UPI0017882430|nr:MULTISPECIES: hypothetical protein [unclassified Psychrobacter]MBE0407716.1 hypothetical protein [Psychrobacter sp. FME6]MBE0445266.1 hypothetical protein [Psychrobacter sp. FME5]MDN5801475.1 hypothetical protein [Psychrobacter sp.]
MRILQHPKIKTALSAGLGVALLGVTAGGTAMAYDNQPVYRGDSSYGNDYRNGDFGRISQKLRQDLRRSGYHVMDIKPDTHRGNRSLTVYAKKDNQPYELKYTYPGLKRISSSKKEWSNVWQDKNHHNGNGYYDNGKYKNHNNRYKNDDIEDNIKREARYPTIKNRAIRKVEGMGYRVKDIELDEKNNRGVFEIEAKRGSQEYEILLGYPNLNVIKIEKD